MERKLNGADLGAAVGVAAPDCAAEVGAPDPKLKPMVGLSFASDEADAPNAGVTAYFPNNGAGDGVAAGEPVTACFPNMGAGDAAPAAGDPNSDAGAGEAAPETEPNRFDFGAPVDAPNLIGVSGFQVLSAGSAADGEPAADPKMLEPPEAASGAARDTREKRLLAAFGVGAGAPSLSSSASFLPLEASDRWANGLPSFEPIRPEPGTYSFKTEFGLEVPDRLLLVSLKEVSAQCTL